MPRGTIQKRIDAERKEIKKETQDFDYDILKINFDVENMLIWTRQRISRRHSYISYPFRHNPYQTSSYPTHHKKYWWFC